ncbi:methylglyoxal synthase [Nisaea acidiphila]|uniref:Methylglyoxal synthase n=1 Tax=Nisaea acidiphila TaxID=1862145 RepID=A0A9J7ATE7_9PROT|nr:methylglyoxal synthase [Nisaea acidiphila]UUX50446.1 methylglyoxal synthase [Nisaea acidiphila]
MQAKKRIGLIAHDARKRALREFVRAHAGKFGGHELFATGTTGRMIEKETGIPVRRFKSGPLGGDQQMGALIADGGLDILIFFTDPMTTMPHDVDVKALVRLCTLYNVVLACNQASADFVLTSAYFDGAYERAVPSYEDYVNRAIS